MNTRISGRAVALSGLNQQRRRSQLAASVLVAVLVLAASPTPGALANAVEPRFDVADPLAGGVTDVVGHYQQVSSVLV